MMYFKLVRYKHNVVKHNKTDEIIYVDGISFIQFVSDNTDLDPVTLNCKNAHHGLCTVAVVNRKLFKLFKLFMFEIVQFNDKESLEISWRNG